MHHKLRARAHAGWAIHQTVTALAAIGVIVAMVAVAQRARQDEKRHQTVQVLVERVRASALELENYVWRELAEGFASGKRQLHPGPVVAHALRLWGQLNSAVTTLRAQDHSAPTEVLLNDAGRLYGAGMSLVSSAHGLADVRQGMTSTEALFAPIVDVLTSDAVTAAAAQRRVASQAADRAGVAYFGSLAVGLLLLVLLGFELHRTRRGALLAKQQRRLEQRSEQRIRALVEHLSDIIMVIGPDLSVRWQSTSVETGLGHSPNDVTGRRVSGLAHPDDAQLLESHLAAAMRQSGPVRVTARFGHAKDGWRNLEVIADNRLTDPEVEGVVLSMRDVSDRKALEDELRHQAFHDSLTGLANRALFEDRLAHCLAGARRHGRPAAILFLDLDDFKTINDSLGHASGDELLQAVARRIAGVVRATDTAARLGGDEFAVLVESLDTLHDAEVTAERLLDALMPPFHIAERELRITASIGIAVSDGSTGAENLLRNADTAMYAAKECGKGTAQRFEDGMHERVLARLELTGELQSALERREFELDYQPIVDLQRNEVVGCEALVRWAHPVRGRLLPADFIGIAEDTGLIVPLGARILRAACTQAARWRQMFPGRELEMNVNVSTRQLRDPGFPDIVAAALKESGLPPPSLVLEITESLLPDDDDRTIERLHELKAVGVQVAVDDFGTGYSALSRLQDYPVDILKIDRSFINGIEYDPGKAQLVRGIVDLGKSLEMTVVAEGIEEPEQADHLRRLHSPLGQGYLFSRPVSPDQVESLLQGRSISTDLTPDSGAEPEAPAAAA